MGRGEFIGAGWGWGLEYFWVVLFILAYFGPSIVASAWRHNRVGEVFLLNLFFGWTVVGWVIAMAWAALPDKGAARLFLALGSGVVITLVPTIVMRQASFVQLSLTFIAAALIVVPWRTWREADLVNRLVIPIVVGVCAVVLAVMVVFTVAISIGPPI